LSLGLPIQRVLVSPRFALATILARTARAFHYVTGSKDEGGRMKDELNRGNPLAFSRAAADFLAHARQGWDSNSTY
jgi:hypothetical protein